MAWSALSRSRSANKPIELELTLYQHSKDPEAPFTVTAMFKDPPPYLNAEAWRILRAVVKGKELLPEIVHEYMQKSLARHSARRLLVDRKLLPQQLTLPAFYWCTGHLL